MASTISLSLCLSLAAYLGVSSFGFASLSPSFFRSSVEELLARGKHEGFLRSFKFLQIFKSAGRTTRFNVLMHECSARLRAGRTKWTRTTDLVLIRHAL